MSQTGKRPSSYARSLYPHRILKAFGFFKASSPSENRKRREIDVISSRLPKLVYASLDGGILDITYMKGGIFYILNNKGGNLDICRCISESRLCTMRSPHPQIKTCLGIQSLHQRPGTHTSWPQLTCEWSQGLPCLPHQGQSSSCSDQFGSPVQTLRLPCYLVYLQD